MKTLIALVLLAIPTSHAFANTSSKPTEALQSVVKYGDLNLTNPAGAEALRRRIDRAVVLLSRGWDPLDARARAEFAASRARGRAQADCLIVAAVAGARPTRGASS